MHSFDPANRQTPPRLILDNKPDWVRLYQTTWEIAESNIDSNLPTGWKPQQTCMPGVGITWVWDSCFMTHYARYSNGFVPIMNNLDNLYRIQREDGYISMAYVQKTEQPAYGERVNPPLFAWAEDQYVRVTGDQSRIRSVLPHLIRLFDWHKNQRRRENGLYWFEDSGSTGMDNSPRSGYMAAHQEGSDICHIDMAAQQALAAESIISLAVRIGDSDTAKRFAAEHEEIKQVVNKIHWNEKTGFYYDVFNRTGGAHLRANHLNHKTAAAFWTLIAGLCSQEQAARLVEHLTNPNEFWTRHPISSLAKDDPNYDDEGGYWLGGVWAPTNYMIVEGLCRYGYYSLAREIVSLHVERMAEVMNHPDYQGIWECYSPEFARPATNAKYELVRPNFVGWSGLGPVAMLIEIHMGIRIQDGAKHIHWCLNEPGKHGILNLSLEHNEVSLICHGITVDTIQIEVQNKNSLKLDLNIPLWNQQETLSLKAGTHKHTLRRSTDGKTKELLGNLALGSDGKPLP